MGRTIATSTRYGIRLHGTDSPATVLAGVTVNSSGTSSYGLYSSFPSPVSVRNLGNVSGSKVGILLDHAGTITNGSVGDDSATIAGAIGIEAFNAGAVVRNLASLDGGVGIYLVHGGRVMNGLATNHSAVLYGYTTGIAMGGHGYVVNNATIASFSWNSRGVTLADGGSVSNGLANASAIISGNYGFGVVFDGGAGSVANGGTISATGKSYSARSGTPGHYTYGTAVVLGGGGDISNGMGGHGAATVEGTYVGINVSGGAGEVRNGGSIIGLTESYYVNGAVREFATFGVGVTLSDGGKVANGTLADPGALIEGGRYGVAISGQAGTVVNKATIASIGETRGFGSSFFFGDGVTLSAGGTVINGLATEATGALITSKNVGIVIAGGSGLVSNDGTVLTPSASYFKQGTGIELQAGGRVVNGSTIVTDALIQANAVGVQVTGGYGTVTNFGIIKGAYYTYGGGGSSGSIYEDSGLGVSLAAGGVVTNGASDLSEATVAGGLYGIIISGQAGKVENSGTVVSAGYGVSYGMEGDYTFYNGAAISLAAGGMVVNGSSASASSALITAGNNGVVISGSAGLVENYATISGVNHSYIGYNITLGIGVVLQAAGYVINGSTSVTSALIEGGAIGVQAGGGFSAVSNDGTVLATTGYVVPGFRGFITGIGVLMTAGGEVDNGVHDVRTALISAARYGVSIAGGPATVTNAGTIDASVGVAFGTGTGMATLTNTGSVIGTSGTAVSFAGGDDVVAIGAGAVFQGSVVASSTGANTIRLLAGVSGSVAGIGSAFVDFDHLDVAAGARWSLNATNTAASSFGITLASGATLRVAGQFTVGSSLSLTGSGTLGVADTGRVVVGQAGAGAADYLTVDAASGTNAAGTVVGRGVVASKVVDDGTIVATGGTLTLDGPATGVGTVAITAHAVLNATQSFRVSNLAFLADGHETAEFAKPATVSPLISGFARTDVIDLLGAQTTGITLSAATQVLTVSGESGSLAHLRFSSGYTGQAFQFAADGHGGTNITLG